MTTWMKRSMRGITLLILICGLAAWRPASAVTISTSADLGAVPGTAGTGLSGSIYQFSSEPSNWAQASTMIAASSGPLATFKTTSICYPDCAGHTAGDSPETFAQYVGSGTNSNSFTYTVPPAQQPTQIANSAMVITGYIAISQAGTYNFNLGSDDSSLLYIGGQQVVNNDGQKNFGFASGAATFTQAGLYTITLDYAEASGSAGLEFSVENSAGACVIGTANCTGGAAQTGAFYSSLPATATATPEPASLSVLATGVAAIFGLRRRRRRA
jgi:hypothetical protein